MAMCYPSLYSAWLKCRFMPVEAHLSLSQLKRQNRVYCNDLFLSNIEKQIIKLTAILRYCSFIGIDIIKPPSYSRADISHTINWSIYRAAEITTPALIWSICIALDRNTEWPRFPITVHYLSWFHLQRLHCITWYIYTQRDANNNAFNSLGTYLSLSVGMFICGNVLRKAQYRTSHSKAYTRVLLLESWNLFEDFT